MFLLLTLSPLIFTFLFFAETWLERYKQDPIYSLDCHAAFSFFLFLQMYHISFFFFFGRKMYHKC